MCCVFAVATSWVSNAGANSADCTVNRKCSSTGRVCDDSDRACNESARAENLEIICQTDEPPRFVYCPAETGRSDSKVVWLLLAVACAIATVGGTTLYRAIKKDA